MNFFYTCLLSQLMDLWLPREESFYGKEKAAKVDFLSGLHIQGVGF